MLWQRGDEFDGATETQNDPSVTTVLRTKIDGY